MYNPFKRKPNSETPAVKPEEVYLSFIERITIDENTNLIVGNCLTYVFERNKFDSGSSISPFNITPFRNEEEVMGDIIATYQRLNEGRFPLILKGVRYIEEKRFKRIEKKDKPEDTERIRSSLEQRLSIKF